MTNPKITESKNTEGMFARIFDRLEMIRKYKDDLLNMLNDLEGASCVVSKIQHGNIITVSEHNLLKNFLKIRGLHTDISSVYEDTLTAKNKEGTLNALNDFNKLVENYPFVVNADEISEGLFGSLPENGIAEIWKNGKRGLVKKAKGPDGEDTIQTLFDHNHSQARVLKFSKDEYEKYGIIEGRNYSDVDEYRTIFLQKISNPNNGLLESFKILGEYNMLGEFDRDNICFSKEHNIGSNLRGDGLYKLIHKDISPNGIEIYEVGVSFKSNEYDIRKGFDSFNTFEAEIEKHGKVIFKKSYDDSGKLIGIYAFKKKRFGGEEQVRARDKEH